MSRAAARLAAWNLRNQRQRALWAIDRYTAIRRHDDQSDLPHPVADDRLALRAPVLSKRGTQAILREADMTAYRLHYFPESGNSYKLALMLTLCGQTFDPVWTDFGGGVTRTREWRASINPMGEIPVLEIDGERLTQTAPILLQLSQRHGRFNGESEQEKFEVLRWLFWDNHKLSGTMATYRYRRAFTPSPDPKVQDFLRARLSDFLAILELHLARRPFVVGNALTIADISMCAYLSYPVREAGFDLATSHPAISDWLKRIAAIPGWQAPYDLLAGKRLIQYV